MRTSILLSVLVALLIVPLLPGQVATEATAAVTTKIQDPISHLIPANAFAILRIGALEEVETELQKLVAMVDPDSAQMVNLDMLMAQLDLRIEVDREHPLVAAACFTEDKYGEPTVALILPTKDAKGVAEYLEGEAYDSPPVALGNYVGFAPAGTYAPGAGQNRLWAKMPKRDICGRVDLAMVIKHFREDIDMGLAEMEEQLQMMSEMGGMPNAMNQMMEGYLELAHQLVASSDVLDISLDTDGNELDILGALTVRGGSPLANMGFFDGANLRPLARTIPATHSVSGLMFMELGPMMDMYKEILNEMGDMLPEGVGEQAAKLMDLSSELVKDCDGNMGFSLGTGPKGVEFSESVGVKSSGVSWLESWSRIAADESLKGLGVNVGLSEIKDHAEGVKSLGGTMAIDFKKFAGQFGEQVSDRDLEFIISSLDTFLGAENGAIPMQAYSTDKLVTVGIGGDAAFRKFLGDSLSSNVIPNKTLKWALDKAGQNAGFVLSADMRHALRDIRSIMAKVGEEDEMPPIAEGKPAPVAIHAGTSGLVTHIGVSTVGEGLAPLIKELMQIMRFR